MSCQSTQKEPVAKLKNFELKKYYSSYGSYEFSKIINDSTLTNGGPQLAAFAYSRIGNHNSAIESWDIQFNKKKDPISTAKAGSFKQFRSETAISYILKKATKHQVTIVNEAHHIAQHRVFTTQLLEGLYKQGYRHLGLESFPTTPYANAHLEENGYPTIRQGGFTVEPQFGQMIRSAHQIGFKIFGYDAYGGGIKIREINQAKNIQKYMTAHPEGKVLIHCGFNHGYEGEKPERWEKAMAARLTEFTGIDPFTINQTTFTEKSQKQFEHPYYQLTDVQEPTIYFNPDGKALGDYQKGAWFDVSVFHPRSNQERPDWLLYGHRKRVKLDLSESGVPFPCLVFAYPKGENIDEAIPYDIQETKDQKVTMVLQPGQWNIVLWSVKEIAIMTTIEVN